MATPSGIAGTPRTASVDALKVQRPHEPLDALFTAPDIVRKPQLRLDPGLAVRPAATFVDVLKELAEPFALL